MNEREDVSNLSLFLSLPQGKRSNHGAPTTTSFQQLPFMMALQLLLQGQTLLGKQTWFFSTRPEMTQKGACRKDQKVCHSGQIGPCWKEPRLTVLVFRVHASLIVLFSPDNSCLISVLADQINRPVIPILSIHIRQERENQRSMSMTRT